MQANGGRVLHHRYWVVLTLAALALAYATVIQPLGCTQTAQYALVRSLADGRASIDPYQAETCDKSYYAGHFYATKAPGLAFATLPLFGALDAVGGIPTDPTTAIWILLLLGTVLPAIGLLILVRRLAEDVEPGLGLFAAVTLGIATLVLPFATLYFSHVLATFLAFAAFAVLWRERRGPPQLRLTAIAGILAGLAVTVENPLVLVGIVLFAYAIARSDAIRRGLLYAAGALAGAAPYFLFNWWALGSPSRFVYAYFVKNAGQSGHDVVGGMDEGLFGIAAPSLRVVADLLFSPRGLFLLTPIMALAAAGVVILYRRGWRAEALVIGAVALVFPLYVSGYYYPMGGDVPGPRFLIPTLPFLAIGLAPAYRRFPLLSLTLAVISTVPMILATATQPMLGNDNTTAWLDLVRAGNFTHSVVTLGGGGHGWVAILPFAGAIAIAVVATAVDGWHEVGPVHRDLPRALAGLVVWALVCTAAPDLLRIDRASGGFSGLAAVFLLAIAAVAVVPLARRRPSVAIIATGGLGAAAALSGHTRWALVVAVVTLATVALESLWSWRSDKSLVGEGRLAAAGPKDRAIA